jgi:hypothetical protein
MRTHFGQPEPKDAMNLFGLFFALLASTLAAVLLMALYAIRD